MICKKWLVGLIGYFHLKGNFNSKVRNFLDIRRAQYPFAGAITNDCVHPKDLDKMPRQICQGYSHCQTLVLTDHNAGKAFTIRGCAEHFGAVDPEVLAKRMDNSCKKLDGIHFGIFN